MTGIESSDSVAEVFKPKEFILNMQIRQIMGPYYIKLVKKIKYGHRTIAII